jgi:hypothetical protein
MARANQTFTPVTFGYLRREPKWLHLLHGVGQA